MDGQVRDCGGCVGGMLDSLAQKTGIDHVPIWFYDAAPILLFKIIYDEDVLICIIFICWLYDQFPIAAEKADLPVFVFTVFQTPVCFRWRMDQV